MNIDELSILREISKKENLNQRKLAFNLGISLGKINYCLKKLKERGLIKVINFKANKNKLNYIYILTPKGVARKTKAILNFMKTRIKEYDELKKELNKY